MVTARLPQDEIDIAVDALRDGELVAFPTETVYGLGANAPNPDAVRKVFEVKGRPADPPADRAHRPPAAARALGARRAARRRRRWPRRFWPGPLTLVLRRAPRACTTCVTGGQDTVAIRMPSHPWRGSCCVPSAAASPRRRPTATGDVSPTRAEHVRDEFGDAVKVVLDGGECQIGLESTIV